MKFNGDFIGLDEVNSSVTYTGVDHKNIEYKLNSLGHRCKDLSEINLDEYILFAGCSNTFGIGLDLENTYPYLVSKKLNCDYYNLSISGTGIDVLEYNLLTWFLTIKQKPKALIVQWPDHSRFLNISSDNMFTPMGSWSPDPDATKFILTNEELGIAYSRKLFAVTNIFNMSQCPALTFVVSGTVPYTRYDNFLVREDLASDQLHPGIKSNVTNAEIVLKLLSEYR